MFKNIFNKKVEKRIFSGETPKNEDFAFGLIEYYFKNKKYLPSVQIVDEQFINDMDLDEFFMVCIPNPAKWYAR